MIIGIAGKARTGKDTIGELIQNFRPSTQLVSLASPIKEFAKQVFEFSDEQLYGPSEFRNGVDYRYSHLNDREKSTRTEFAAYDRMLEYGDKFASDVLGSIEHVTLIEDWFESLEPPISPRYVLQTLGTEVGRAINPNIWVNHLLKQTNNPNKLYVCTDVRFENEMRAIREGGGQLWWLTRPGSGLSAVAGTHASELDLDRLDLCAELATVTYHNAGDLEELSSWVRNQLIALNFSNGITPRVGMK